MVFVVWERDSAQGILVVVPSALSAEPQTPISPHMTLVHSALPPPGAQGEWLWTRFCVLVFWECDCASSRLFSPWWTEFLLVFTAISYVGASSWLWCAGPRSPDWSSDPLLPRGKLCSWDSSLELQPPPMAAGPGLFMFPPFLQV